MIDINKQYRTRDGREVRIYATDGWGIYPVHGAVKVEDGWIPYTWKEVGVEGVSNARDLIEVRPRHKRTVWVNMYGTGIVGETCSSKEHADLAAACYRIACIKVELDFEEGEGL
jgi:hypothetical protein